MLYKLCKAINIFSLFAISVNYLSISYADIYKWVDADGATHFSDTPHEGAKTIDLPNTQTFSPTAPKNINSDDDENAKKSFYKSITIIEPQDRITIRNTEGFVALVAKSVPNLKNNDMAQLLLDASPLGDPQKSLAFAVRGIVRGSHTLAVQILSKDGKVIITSPTITVYMMPPRTNMS